MRFNKQKLEILIFAPEKNSRIVYSFHLIFSQILKVPHQITTDKEHYLSYEGPKFVYRKSPLDKGLFFYSADLLFEKGIKNLSVQVQSWQDLRILFVNENYGALPFDPFAASFYLVTRYEEYNAPRRDAHQRFEHNRSIAKRNNFLHIPVVNYYAELVKNKLLEHYPNLFFPELSYNYLPTIDIDNAYAYKHKGLLRMLSTILESAFKLKFENVERKIKICFGKETDPYDTYEKQFEIHERYHLKPLYFILIGELSRFDRNLEHKNPHFFELIKKIAQRYRVGLHPSYASNKKTSLIKKEKARLENITEEHIDFSRQHFLKLKLPETYQNLIENGIKEDFSMGYSKENGFRASICTPFYFYDLQNEQMTDLLVHPFCIMDSTMKYHMKLRSDDVIYAVKPLIEQVKKMKGELVTVFHNESLGTHKIWKNWGDVYETVVKAALPNKF